MQLEGRRIWQVAGGLKERSYVDALLEWDAIIIGPGDDGPWPQCTERIRQYAPQCVPILQRFADMRPGDLVVLRLGTDQVYGVGEITDDQPTWLDDFGDVDGWSLQIVRRVRWLWKYDGVNPKMFPVHTLKFGPTVLKMDADPVLHWITELGISTETWNRELAKLPESCKDGVPIRQVSPNEIGEALYDRGIGEDSVDGLLSRIDELIRIARWYTRAGIAASEQETIAYLTLPLLQSLGWSPQKMAVQWDFIDIGLFDRMPRARDTLVAVVEAKKLREPIRIAFRQAADYAERVGRSRCGRLILTDGLRYYVYVRNGDGRFTTAARAYLNLARIVGDYPLLHLAGAQEALALMAHDWSGYIPPRSVDLPDEQIQA